LAAKVQPDRAAAHDQRQKDHHHRAAANAFPPDAHIDTRVEAGFGSRKVYQKGLHTARRTTTQWGLVSTEGLPYPLGQALLTTRKIELGYNCCSSLIVNRRLRGKAQPVFP